MGSNRILRPSEGETVTRAAPRRVLSHQLDSGGAMFGRPDTEPGLEKWLRLNAEYTKVWPNITIKKPPPPNSKDWEGKPDKLQFFSPNPGAGD